ncbi:MAG: FKBP-type peptidyl-prolyl cis-trans isomerase [Proteobacteria bacterium]|nr:FKBP-type peptidyl-prolyl cis-trans isomerase [Pseudomonadota bacterium]
MKIYLLFLNLLFILSSFTSYAEESQLLKTEKDKVNYSIGVNLINNFKQQEIDIDLDLVIKGMKDAYNGNKLLLSPEEIKKSLDIYQTAVRQKRATNFSKISEENKKKGDAFLSENSKREGVVTLQSGLQYKIIKKGEGKIPTENDVVECNFIGTLIDGTEFENTYKKGNPAILKVSTAIPGLREALKIMPLGSKWQIFIPPKLAYGTKKVGSYIGPNSVLIYELELISVK